MMPYHSDDSANIIVYDDRVLVVSPEGGSSTYEPISFVTREVTKFIFRISDIEKYEVKNGITPRLKDGHRKTVNKMTIIKIDKNKAKEIAEQYIKDCENRGNTPFIYKAKKLIEGELSRDYKDKKTIHNWIKELFPKESRRQGMGRPKK
jgi:hypothetical protein